MHCECQPYTTQRNHTKRYLYTFLVWLRWVVYGWHSQCKILFWCDYEIWLALSMHFRRGICILFWCDYVGLYMVGTLNAFTPRYLYTFLVWLRWVVYGWHSQCIFAVFVYFFGVMHMVGTLNAFSAQVFVTIYNIFGVITPKKYTMVGIMHFWRGICILFWCDYVGLYMVGTLNAFSARYLYTFLVWLRWVVYGWHSQCIFGKVFVPKKYTLGCIWLAYLAENAFSRVPYTYTTYGWQQ